MNKIFAKVISLKVGKIQEIDFDKKLVKTAIKKIAIKESYLSKLGFNEDEQYDKRYHGGENKAVLFFSILTYEKINNKLDINLSYEKSSPLGENILVSNITEDDICVGDILKLGEAIVQVTQPREPCNKLSLNTQNKNMLKTVYQNGYTGWYAKVLEEGLVKSSDNIELISRVHPNLTISDMNKSIINPKDNKSLILEAISCEVLGKPFKEALEKSLG